MAPLSNIKHEQFVQNLASPNSDTFGNQTKSYASVYNTQPNNSTWTTSSRLLRNVEVKNRFLELMEAHGLTDDLANSKHKEIIEKAEPATSLKAVRMLHELKGRLGQARDTEVKKSINLNVNVDLNNMSQEDKINKIQDMLDS